jgi:hypothetical protein
MRAAISKRKPAFVAATAVVLLSSIALITLGWPKARISRHEATGERMRSSPSVILWAWERPVDLRFIDAKQVAIAFLARTILLRESNIVVRPRLQPLEVPDHATVIAVARIETGHRKTTLPLDAEQRHQVAVAIADLANLPRVSSVQIDFDATQSERAFYHDLIIDVRERLPRETGLSVTALASWCADDDWLADLPIDEAVPMLFRMGPDRRPILESLLQGRRFAEPFCQQSYGISTDEPLGDLPRTDRLYVFNPGAWSEASVRAILDSRK